MRVWVTRAQPGADATAERLLRLGHAPLVAPLLQARPIPETRLDLADIGALAFTSTRAAACFAELNPVRDLPVFAVGEATAAAARAAGFGAVVSADADVEALARLIAARRSDFAGVVLHSGAREPAGDLIGALAAAGVPARAVAIYEVDAVSTLPEPAAAALAEDRLDAVLVHSPKAARVLAALAPPSAAARLSALALSPACAAPLAGAGFRSVVVAPAPREADLFGLLAP